MIPDKFHRTVVVPVRIRKGVVELLYGGPIPALADGTVGDLVVPAFAFRDPEILQAYVSALAGPILNKGTRLLASVPGATEGKAGLLWHTPDGASADVHGPFVEFELLQDLELTLRGTKRAVLKACRCRIGALPEVKPGSVNHALTIITGHFEPNRISRGGNVFRKVLYLDRAASGRGAWRSLEDLRLPREAAIEQRVRSTAASSPA